MGKACASVVLLVVLHILLPERKTSGMLREGMLGTFSKPTPKMRSAAMDTITSSGTCLRNLAFFFLVAFSGL